MSSFELSIVEPENFYKRYKKDLIINYLAAIFVFFVVKILSNWVTAIFAAIVLLIVQNMKSHRWDKYFIIFIKEKEGYISINYKDRNNLREIKGLKRDFDFKKELAFDRVKTPYLAIYFKETLKIKQFEIGDWNEAKFDQVISALTN